MRRLMVLLVALLAGTGSALAQDQGLRLQDRTGRGTAYADRLAGSQNQHRTVGRDGRARGYVDGTTGQITGATGGFMATSRAAEPPLRGSLARALRARRIAIACLCRVRQ